MRASTVSATAAAILALPLTTLAATLNDWEPRLANLNPKCKAVYTAEISGCNPSDFQQGATCNPACLVGLKDIAAHVKTGCGDEDFGSDTEAENILLCFLAGDGPGRVCPNNAVSTSSSVVSGTSTKTMAVSTTSSRPATTTATSSQSETRSSRSETSISTTSSEEPSSTETETSTISTAASEPDSTSAASSASPTPSSSGDSQGNISGGGSPFDDAPSSGDVSSVPIAAGLLTAIFLAALLR